MSVIWNMIESTFTIVKRCIGYFLGGYDGLLYALAAFMIVNYFTAWMCVLATGKLSRSIGWQEICKKVLIFLLVGIANIIDIHIIGNGSMLRAAVILFYISNEGVSLLKNAAHLDLPIPEKLKLVLEEFHDWRDNSTEDRH